MPNTDFFTQTTVDQTGPGAGYLASDLACTAPFGARIPPYQLIGLAQLSFDYRFTMKIRTA